VKKEKPTLFQKNAKAKRAAPSTPQGKKKEQAEDGELVQLKIKGREGD